MAGMIQTAASRASTIVVTAIVTTVVIAGGVAFAAVPSNSVTSAKIVDGTIQAVDLGPNSVTSAKIANNSITNVDLTAGLRGQLVSGVVMAEQVGVSPGGSGTIEATVDCPGVLVAVAGGGEETDTSVRAFLVDSRPSEDGLGWYVRYRSDDGADFESGDEVTAFATCGPA